MKLFISRTYFENHSARAKKAGCKLKKKKCRSADCQFQIPNRRLNGALLYKCRFLQGRWKVLKLVGGQNTVQLWAETWCYYSENQLDRWKEKRKNKNNLQKKGNKYNLQNVNNLIIYVSQTFFRNHGLFFDHFAKTRNV